MKLFCFLSPEVHRSWKKGRLASVIFPTVLIVHWCLCLSCDLEVWSTNLMFAVWIGISSSGGRLNWYRQRILLLVILITEYIVSDLGRLMIRWHSAMVKRWQGSPRSPQSSPQSARVQVQVVVNTAEDHLFHVLSVCGLITISNEANDCCVICHFQWFNRWVSQGALVCVEWEQQWGANISLGGASVDYLGAASPAAFGLSGSWWRQAQWACWVCRGRRAASWSPQTGRSLYLSLANRGVAGCSAVQCWLQHPLTYL